METWLASRSPITQARYRAALQDFTTWVGLEDPAEAVRGLLEGGPGRANLTVTQYANELEARGLAPGTVAQRLAALRAIVAGFRRGGLVSWRLEPSTRRLEKARDVAGPPLAAVQDAWRALGRWGARGTRLRLVLRLAFDLDLRVSEVASLDWPDSFIFERSAAALPVALRVRRKHRRKLSTWQLSRGATDALRAYLAVRGTRAGPLLVGRGGQRLTVRSLQLAFRRLGEAVGATITPNGLRHTASTHAVREATKRGLTLDEVREWSGHSDVRTLLIYADKDRQVQRTVADLVGDLLEDP